MKIETKILQLTKKNRELRAEIKEKNAIIEASENMPKQFLEIKLLFFTALRNDISFRELKQEITNYIENNVILPNNKKLSFQENLFNEINKIKKTLEN